MWEPSVQNFMLLQPFKVQVVRTTMPLDGGDQGLLSLSKLCHVHNVFLVPLPFENKVYPFLYGLGLLEVPGITS